MRLLKRTAPLALAITLTLTAHALAKWERIETYRVGDEPTSVAVGELTRDGISDVVVGNALSSYVSFFKSRPDGLYNLPVKVKMGKPQAAVGIGRFNGDRRNDIVAAADLSNKLIVRYGQSRGFGKPRTNKTGRGPAALAVGRLDRDGRDDVVVANAASDSVTVFKGSRKGLERSRTAKVGDGPVSVAIGDVGGSGRSDIVTVNAQSRDITILLGRDNGFSKPRRIAASTEPTSVAVGQLGKGGKADIAVASASSRLFTVLYGGKNRLEVRRFNGLKGADGIDIGRIGNDRRADIGLASSAKSKVGIFNGRSGGFSRGKVLAIPGGPTAIKIAHLDFDPNRDMATANVDGFSGSIIHQV